MMHVTIAAIIGAALSFVAYSIYADVEATGAREATLPAYLELIVALLIALGFAFVNGFHDTANAVATVIYTRSLTAPVAVVWSGIAVVRRCRLRHRFTDADRLDPAA